MERRRYRPGTARESLQTVSYVCNEEGEWNVDGTVLERRGSHCKLCPMSVMRRGNGA